MTEDSWYWSCSGQKLDTQKDSQQLACRNMLHPEYVHLKLSMNIIIVRAFFVSVFPSSLTAKKSLFSATLLVLIQMFQVLHLRLTLSVTHKCRYREVWSRNLIKIFKFKSNVVVYSEFDNVNIVKIKFYQIHEGQIPPSRFHFGHRLYWLELCYPEVLKCRMNRCWMNRYNIELKLQITIQNEQNIQLC